MKTDYNFKSTPRLFILLLALMFSGGVLQAQYCSFSADCSWGDQIEDFSTSNAINNISNLGSGCSTNGYGDYTSTDTVTADLGTSFDIAVQTDYFAFAPQGFTIWIDWNQDGDFSDPGEEVWNSGTDGIQLFTGTVNVPPTATLGNTTMRVMCSYTCVPTNPCSGCDPFGEAEDYTVEVTAPPTCLAPSGLTAMNVGTSSADLDWTENNSATDWEIEWGVQGFVQGNGTTVLTSLQPYPLSGLNSSTGYDFYVRSVCAAGDTSIWAGPFTFTTGIACPSSFQASISNSTDVSCNGGNDGSASVSAQGGASPYTYLWSNNAVGANVTGLSQGSYSVTVTDANNCTTTASVTINEPSVLTASISNSTNVSCNGLSDGSAQAEANGGTSPYNYNWSNGDSTAQASNLSAGTYDVTVTDANGCTSTSSVTIEEPDTLTAMIDTMTAEDASCYGYADGRAEVTVQGGTAPYTYAWTSGAATAEASNLPADTNEVTVTDANGCTTTAMVEIDQPERIDTTLLRHNPKLIANLEDAAYQWYNCTTGELVPGATSRDFTPTENDVYAAIITFEGCVDTTACEDVMIGSASNIASEGDYIEVYPNPNDGLFQVRMTGHSKDAIQLQVADMQGKLLLDRNIGRLEGETVEQLQMNIASGVYFVKVIRDGELSVKRVVVH